MLDEPSLGLAPLMVKEIMRLIRTLRDCGDDGPAGRAEREPGFAPGRPRLRYGDGNASRSLGPGPAPERSDVRSELPGRQSSPPTSLHLR